MTAPEGLTATIEEITPDEVLLRVQGRIISYPKSLINDHKKPGDTLILCIKDDNSNEEAHYQAMKRVLKELVQ